MVKKLLWPMYQLIEILDLLQNFVFFLNFVFSFRNFGLFFPRKLRPSRMYLSPISVMRVCRWFWHTTWGDSQARHETLWLVHPGPLKRRDLNKARQKHRGYTRGSKARRVFPSTFRSCLGFPQRECTAGIICEPTHSNLCFVCAIITQVYMW